MLKQFYKIDKLMLLMVVTRLKCTNYFLVKLPINPCSWPKWPAFLYLLLNLNGAYLRPCHPIIKIQPFELQTSALHSYLEDIPSFLKQATTS